MTVILTLTMAISTILSNIIKGGKLSVEGLETKTEPETKPESSEPVEEMVADTTKTNKPTAKPTSSPKNVEPKKVEHAPTTSPSQLMETLKDQALDLQEAQKHIIDGFEKIEPHMDRAETLIGSIQQTAQTIQGMRNMQNV